MLKTRIDDEIWLVHQPDHARVSGYLAAHWGEVNGFARPGDFAPCPDAQRLRQEVILAIAEHDNGWWEWEASPEIDPTDHLPLDLFDVGSRSPAEATQRWKMGVPRLSESHPYAALLISLHAFYLYAYGAIDDIEIDEGFRHPLFGNPDRTRRLVEDSGSILSLLKWQKGMESELRDRMRQDATWRSAIEPAHLYPHCRLLQLLDSVSLLLSFGGRQSQRFADIPRARWDDRITLDWQPLGSRTICCDPFPFDRDPLEVFLPARILRQPNESGDAVQAEEPIRFLHATPLSTIRFELVSKR